MFIPGVTLLVNVANFGVHSAAKMRGAHILMKIVSFGTRPDEAPYLTEWSERTGIELKQITATLNEDNVDQAAGYDGITCMQTVPYSAALFQKMADLGIKFLSIRNVGLDNIDMAGAKAAGVRISNVPAYSPEAIAEFAVTMIMHLIRNMGQVEQHLRKNDYNGAMHYIGRNVGDCTVGVIGTGRIGRAAIQIFEGFGAKVLGYDPYPAKNTDIDYVDLDTLLRESDIIDLHVPGLPSNTHMIDAAAFDKMKDRVIIVNTARGNLIDTQALLDNLRSGKVAGAGIDTFEYEEQDLLNLEQHGSFNDPVWDEMMQMPNVVLSPHIAYYTETAVRNMVEFSLANLMGFLEKGAAENEVTK